MLLLSWQVTGMLGNYCYTSSYLLAVQMPVLCVATHSRSLCCTFKRDNIQNRHCLHAEGEGPSGNPYPKLQLPFSHTCTGFLLKWHKTCPKSCTQPNLACLLLHTNAMPFCSPPSTRWKQCCQVKGYSLGECLQHYQKEPVQQCWIWDLPSVHLSTLPINCGVRPRASARGGEGEEGIEISTVPLENH